MTTYQLERAVDVIEEIEPLLQMHWREIAHYQDIPLAPDWEWYRTSPIVRVFTARDEGRLVGYAVFLVVRNKHYMTSLQGMQDIMFLLPEYRGRTVGPRLIDFCEEQLKAEGVQAVYHHVKRAHDFGPLLERKGYESVDTIYAKRLDKE